MWVQKYLDEYSSDFGNLSVLEIETCRYEALHFPSNNVSNAEDVAEDFWWTMRHLNTFFLLEAIYEASWLWMLLLPFSWVISFQLLTETITKEIHQCWKVTCSVYGQVNST